MSREHEHEEVLAVGTIEQFVIVNMAVGNKLVPEIREFVVINIERTGRCTHDPKRRAHGVLAKLLAVSKPRQLFLAFGTSTVAVKRNAVDPVVEPVFERALGAECFERTGHDVGGFLRLAIFRNRFDGRNDRVIERTGRQLGKNGFGLPL